IQCRLKWGQLRIADSRPKVLMQTELSQEFGAFLLLFTAGGSLRQPREAEVRELCMIHLQQACGDALVFAMAARTVANGRANRGGLTLEQGCIVRVAADALDVVGAGHRRMTGRAILF